MEDAVTARDAKRWDERLHEHDLAIDGFRELHAESQKQTALMQQMIDSDQEWKRVTEKRVCALEAIPGKRWDTAIDRFVFVGASSIATYAAMKIFGG